MGNEASRQVGAQQQAAAAAAAALMASPQSAGNRPNLRPPPRDPLYHMKVVVRGARKSGKTSLLRRLQGLPFNENYEPTPEIQSANIKWTYKTTDDKINVEIWDVVDRILADEQLVGSAVPEDMPAGIVDNSLKYDADHINVYKDAHAVVVLFNPIEKRSWDHALGLVEEVPPTIPVLLLSNFKDLTVSHASIDSDDVEDAIRALNKRRAKNGGKKKSVMFLEASMLDCFGLKTLYNYFNIPYVELKIDVLRKQLEQATTDLDTLHMEVQTYIEEQDYAKYTKWREETRALKSPGGRPGGDIVTSPGAVSGSQSYAPRDSPVHREVTSPSPVVNKAPGFLSPSKQEVPPPSHQSKPPSNALNAFLGDSDDDGPLVFNKASNGPVFTDDEDDIPAAAATLSKTSKKDEKDKSKDKKKKADADVGEKKLKGKKEEKKKAKAKNAFLDSESEDDVPAPSVSKSKKEESDSDDDESPIVTKKAPVVTAPAPAPAAADINLDDLFPSTTASTTKKNAFFEDEEEGNSPSSPPVSAPVVAVSVAVTSSFVKSTELDDFTPSSQTKFLDEDEESEEAEASKTVAPSTVSAVEEEEEEEEEEIPPPPVVAAPAPAPAPVKEELDFAPPTASSGLGDFLDDDDDDSGALAPPQSTSKINSFLDDEDDEESEVVYKTSVPADITFSMTSSFTTMPSAPVPAPAPAAASSGMSAVMLAAIEAAKMAAAQQALESGGNNEEEEGESFGFSQGDDGGKKKKKKDKKEGKEKKEKKSKKKKDDGDDND